VRRGERKTLFPRRAGRFGEYCANAVSLVELLGILLHGVTRNFAETLLGDGLLFLFKLRLGLGIALPPALMHALVLLDDAP
jgi:hypothetical protein